MPNLYLLTAQDTLESCLELFPISCEVDGLSGNTINDYKFKVRRFVGFCANSNVRGPASVLASQVSLPSTS